MTMRIWKIILSFCIAGTLLLSAPAYAQLYTGGSYDGYSSVSSSDTAIGGKAVTISSRANQVFMVGASAAEIATILIADKEGGAITAADATGDIRVRIPTGFNMSWDTSDAVATLGGGAASKCSTAVTFEDSNKTLKINVTSDFAAGENVAISGLSFISFSAASSVDHLGLNIYNGGYNYVTDDKIIEVIAASDVLYAGGSGDGYSLSASGDYKFDNNQRLEGLRVEGAKLE